MAAVMAGIILSAIGAGCGSANKSFGDMADMAVSGNEVGVISMQGRTHQPVASQRAQRGADEKKPEGGKIENVVLRRTSKVDQNQSTDRKEIPAMTRPMTPKKQTKKTQPANVEHVGTSDFQDKVLESEQPVLVDFYADWCGPCRMLTPILEQVARDTPDAKVVKVNIDHSPQLAQQYRVTAVPTMIVFKNGVPVAHQSGQANKGTLQKLLAR